MQSRPRMSSEHDEYRVFLGFAQYLLRHRSIAGSYAKTLQAP